MLIENLLFEIEFKKDGLKYINEYLIDEVNENWCSYKGEYAEAYRKIFGLLHANSSLIESIEKILNTYQEEIDNRYSELLETEI